jgi:transcriptional regulator with XRE-family HTH domain
VDDQGALGKGAGVPPLSPRHLALGDALRELRKARGLTQETLGDLSGLTTNYVGDTERGERNVSVRALWQLSDGLGVSASDLLRQAELHETGKRSPRG